MGCDGLATWTTTVRVVFNRHASVTRMSSEFGPTAQHLAESPAAANACAVRRLVAYLAACACANGNHIIRDEFTFTEADGDPAVNAARRFAEEIRRRYHDEEYGYRIGVRQGGNRVVVRLIPLEDRCADDAVVRASARSC